MSRREDQRPAFKRAVFAARMPDSVKVLLLRLHEDMNHKLIVSVPRTRLAEDLGVPPARISERIKVARERGFLGQVRRGRPGVTAVYQGYARGLGTESVPLEVRPPVPSWGTESVPTSGGLEVRPDHTQVVERSSTGGTVPGGRSPRRSSYEERVPPRADSELTACPWHEDSPCPSDCRFAPANQRESA